MRMHPLLLLIVTGFAMAAEPMEDEDLAGVSGAGIAIALEDWRFSMEPSGYMEQIGSDWQGARPAGLSFRRGDLRWYGFTLSGISGVGGQTTWTEANCASQGFNGLGCPRGGGVPRFAAHDNPYIVRAFNYSGFNTDGATISRTVLDVLAPSTAGAAPAIANAQDNYRFAFWGEILVDRNSLHSGDPGAGGTGANRLKSQTIIQGNAQNSVLRLFRVTDPAAGNTNVANQTLGIFYHSYLKGDFRFSLAQTGTTSDAEGVPVAFHPNEGLHFRNVAAYVPLGQMFYQAMTLDSTRGPAPGYALVKDGNFTLELGRIPNIPNVYADFYSLVTGDTLGYTTARNGLAGVSTTPKPGARYYETHGYSRWGDWFPTCAGTGCVASTGTRNAGNATDDGIFFYGISAFPLFTYRWSRLDVTDFRARVNSPSAADRLRLGMTRGAEGTSGNGTLTNFTRYDTTITANTAVNLGDSRIEGLSINYMRLTSLGANQ